MLNTVKWTFIVLLFNFPCLNFYCFINRAWLDDSKLKDIKHKIVVFKSEHLKGKISKDSYNLKATKPVRERSLTML